MSERLAEALRALVDAGKRYWFQPRGYEARYEFSIGAEIFDECRAVLKEWEQQAACCGVKPHVGGWVCDCECHEREPIRRTTAVSETHFGERLRIWKWQINLCRWRWSIEVSRWRP